jgi:hypothetical protein
MRSDTTSSPPRWQYRRPRHRHLRTGLFFLAFGLVGFPAGCDGSNLFQEGSPVPPPASGEAFRAQVLRFFEEGTQLVNDDVALRFRWAERAPLLEFVGAIPERERQAFLRAVQMVETAGASPIQVVSEGGTIRVEGFLPDAYRERDPSRPWSFSRTFVTATPQTGITDVEILFSFSLSQRELERAALHAMGHAVGIMGHPAFPGDVHVMASRPEGDQLPTSFAAVEREAIRFLYSAEVRPGMTRPELRELFEFFFTSGGS